MKKTKHLTPSQEGEARIIALAEKLHVKIITRKGPKNEKHS